MRRTAGILIVLLVLVASTVAFAQSVTIDLKDLDTVTRNRIIDATTKQTPTNTIDDAKKWVGLGREIGLAFDAGLGAVVKHTEAFGATKIGLFVMALIAWNVVGSQFLRLFVAGGGTLLCAAILCFFYWKNFMTRRLLVEYNKETKTKKWEIINNVDKMKEDEATAMLVVRILFFPFLALLFAIGGCNALGMKL